jgi:hypothetical protein
MVNGKMNLVYYHVNDSWCVVSLSSLREILIDAPVTEMILRVRDSVTAQVLQPDIYGGYKTFISPLAKIPNDPVEISEDESLQKKRVVAFMKQKGWKVVVGKFLVKKVETF